MSLAVTIGGADVTLKIARNSFSLQNAIGQRDTLALSVISKDGTYRPPIGAPVVVTHSELGVLFGGTIRRTQTSLFGTSITSAVQCASWEQLFDRRLCGQVSYTNQSAGDIFGDIFSRYMGAEGVTASIVTTGPVIPSVAFDFCTVREALDQICQLASDAADTYMWDCTPGKVLRFYSQASFPAPIDLTEDRHDIFRNIVVTRTFDGYVNKVYVRLGKYITEERTNTFHPDGSQVSVAFELPIAKQPTVTLNGAELSVGVRDVDTGKDCYWQDGSAEVTFTVAPAGTSTVIIKAQGYQATVVDAAEDAGEITERGTTENNSGYYMTLLESSDPGTSADAVTLAEAYLAKFGKVPYAVEYQTTYGGLKAGQHQRVHLTKFGDAFDATFIIESATLVQENGIWSWRVRAINGALANNWLTKLRKIASGKGSALSGGNSGTVTPSSAGDSGPAPAASNVTAATVTVQYGMWANASAYGFSGSLTLPTSAPSYHQPKFVHVVVTLPDASTAEICPPVPAGTTTFHGPVEYIQDGSAHNLSFAFLCENEDGAISASPFTTSVTVNPSAVTAVVGREIPASVAVDGVTRLVSTTIGATPTLSGGQIPQNATYLLSEDNGTTFVWIGWDTIKTAGQEILFKRVKPATAQTWKVAMVAGAVGGDPSKRIAAASLPTGAVVSGGFTVAALAVPAANLITSLTVSAGAGGNYPYNQTTADGTQYFSIPQFSYDDSACVNDPNAFVVNTTVQDLDSSHNPIGPEQLFATTLVKGQVQTLGPLAGAYGSDGFSYTRSNPYPGGTPANLAYVRVKQYASNRVDQTPTALSNPLASTQQTGLGGGVGYVDVTIANAGGIPAGKVAASRLVGTVPGNTLPLGADATLALDGSGNVIVNQPAVVISNLSGNLNVSRVSSLNTVAVASFSGNLDVSRVNNVYTLYVWGFSGNLDISRVSNLGTITIGSFSGNLDVSRVNNLTTLSLSSFSGNLDVSRVSNLNTLSISNFSGNLDISRVTNITSINIGTLSGTLNVTYQIADGSIPINKIATLYVNNIQGWDGAQILCPSGILFTNGAGSILSIGSGGFAGSGTANLTGYWVQHYGSPILVIDNFANGGFNNLQVNGTTTWAGEAGQTTSAIAIQKPDGSTGYLRFKNGALVAITNF